jgi:hypothetical protein
MSNNYGPKIVTDGLVLCLDAADQNSYSGSGNTWYDLSGNGNNGTISGAPYGDVNGGVFIFNSYNDKIVIPHNSMFNFGSVFSLFTWVKINDLTPIPWADGSSIRNIFAKKARFNNTEKGWSFQYDFRNVGILELRNNNGWVLNDSTPISPVDNKTLLYQTSQYNYTGFTLNNSILKFYINGTQRGTTTIAYIDNDTTNDIYIGDAYPSVNQDDALLMNLSHTTLYNRVLSSEDVLKNYNATKGRFGL